MVPDGVQLFELSRSDLLDQIRRLSALIQDDTSLISVKTQKSTKRVSMKLWQLFSVLRGEIEILRKQAMSRSEWHYLVDVIDNWTDLVDRQDRSILDLPPPVEFVEACLKGSNKSLYLSRDGILRMARRSIFDKKLGVGDAARKFGLSSVEEAFEFGSISVI